MNQIMLMSVMAVNEASAPSISTRPPWWKICVASVVGVVTGAFLFLVLQLPFTFLLDLFFGRSGWQESLAGSPQAFRLVLLILYWTIPLSFGQLLSTVFSRWAGTIYFAAVLQTFQLVVIYGDFAFGALWLLPTIIASILVFGKWAAAGAEKGRIFEAKRQAVRSNR